MVREQEVVRVDERGIKKGFSLKKLVVLTFILLILSLLVYAFYDKIPNITGNVINFGRSDENETNNSQIFDIRAELNELNRYLEINQKIGKISIELGKSDASIYFGKDGALNLSGLDKTNIEIEGFNGIIVFDKDKIYNLNGNVFKLSVNEISTSSPNSEMKISISNELNYNSLELDSVSIKKYDSVGEVGKVIINDDKVSFNLNQENFSIQKFSGKLESGLVGRFGIKKQGLILDGVAEGVNVGGKFKIDVSL